jgi:hypothetical protein
MLYLFHWKYLFAEEQGVTVLFSDIFGSCVRRLVRNVLRCKCLSSFHFKIFSFLTTNRSSIPFGRTAHTQNQLSIETHKRVSLSNCTREARWGAQRIKKRQKVSMELSWQTIKHLLCLSMLEEASNKACLSY